MASPRGTGSCGFALPSPSALVIVRISHLESAMPDALSPVGDPEGAKIIALVSSIPLAVDLACYDLAEAAFAPEVVIDYTSLWGGQPQRMTPRTLMDAWRSLVPGFDATRHELKDVETKVEGAEATATAFVDGRHWIDGSLWRPIGTFRWTLRRMDGRWKVTGMTFAMTQEVGDRGLAKIAAERAKLRVEQGQT
jgi:hypothetical protein